MPSAQAGAMQERTASLVNKPSEITREANALLAQTNLLKMQPPKTLFRLRVVEIGLPLAMSCISILLTLRLPANRSPLARNKRSSR